MEQNTLLHSSIELSDPVQAFHVKTEGEHNKLWKHNIQQSECQTTDSVKRLVLDREKKYENGQN